MRNELAAVGVVFCVAVERRAPAHPVGHRVQADTLARDEPAVIEQGLFALVVAGQRIGSVTLEPHHGAEVPEVLVDGIRIGDGLGADVVVDAAGVSQSLAAAMQAVRPGGQITKVGWGKQPLGFSIDPIVQKNVRLQGSFSHNWPIWERVLAMMASGQLDVSPLVSRVAPLIDWESCFSGMHDGQLVKAVLVPELTLDRSP